MCEGTVKAVLTNTALPVDVSPLAAGAALIDLALFGVIAVVLARVRLPDPRAVARSVRGPAVVVGVALAGWLLLSAIQVFTSPSIRDALEGIRLTHAYLLLVPAGFLVFRDTATREGLLRILLGILVAVMLYATLRGIVGPDPAEKAAAIGRDSATVIKGSFRGVGSFSSAVGLSSAAGPAAVFGLVLGALSRRYRVPALTLAALGFGAMIASLNRTPLLATFAAVVFACLVIVRTGLHWRRQLALAGGMAGAVALLAAGAVLASAASPALEDRLGGLVRPWSDSSMQMRYDTWEDELRRVDDHPFGRGLGTVGRASGILRGDKVTTDSSYLKVLVEQGYPGIALLLLALLGTIGLLARSIARSRRADRALGVAALSAFVAFAILMATGETIEQPGKVLAWTFLGIAVAAVRPAGGAPAPRAPLMTRLPAAARAESRARRSLWATAAVVLTLATLAVTLPRQQHFVAEALVVPTRVAPFPARPDSHFLRQLYETEQLGRPVVRTTGVAGMQRPAEVEMRDATDAEGSVIRVESDDPDRSLQVLNAIGFELRAASSRHLAGLARDRLASMDVRQRTDPRMASRRAVDTSRLRALAAAPPPQIAIAAPPERPSPSRAVDRLLDALPGPYPRRPDPLELGLVVPFAVLCAWLAALALAPPRRESG
jgi:hypothetical protein